MRSTDTYSAEPDAGRDPAAQADRGGTRASRIGSALRHRNFRLFFFGQGVSLIGTWLSRFATIWLAYRLTRSPLMLGLVGFVGLAPMPIFAPMAGVLIDRWDRHRTIIATQVAAMLQAAALAVFALTGTITVWHLLVLGAAQGVIGAFEMPARQAFFSQMIDDKADLPNAVALNSTMINAARLLGPVIAAGVVGAVGEGWCFAIDALSYVGVIASFLMMQVKPRAPRAQTGRMVAELAAGLRHVWGLPLVRSVLLLLFASTFFSAAYPTLLPVLVEVSLHGGPHTLGILMGSAGCGALAGALYMAGRASTLDLDSIVARSAIVLGAGLAALELATSLWIALPVMFIVGLAMIVQLAATNTLVQMLVDDSMLGRVISLYAVACFGGPPLGSLLQGAVASWLGARHTFLLAGIACMAGGLVFASASPRRRTGRVK